MIPEILLSFISIFVALIAFIIRLVWGIKAMYSEMDRNVKLQSFPIVIFWFLLMSKSMVHLQLNYCTIFFWCKIIWSVFPYYIYCSVLLWHFTAVSCSLCKNIEVEVEEEAEFRRTGERRNRYDDECWGRFEAFRNFIIVFWCQLNCSSNIWFDEITVNDLSTSIGLCIS